MLYMVVGGLIGAVMVIAAYAIGVETTLRRIK